jgi:hypothetical protein
LPVTVKLALAADALLEAVSVDAVASVAARHPRPTKVTAVAARIDRDCIV